MDPKKILLTVVFLLSLFSNIIADDYKIGPGDVLEIRFWQKTDLNTSVRVNESGSITLDMIGNVEAAGKTTTELQIDIVRAISRFDAQISQTTVRVEEFHFQHVYIKGQVLNPGKYAFESIPDLWNLISEAGGVNQFGDLSRVLIIRGGEEGGDIEIVNVAQAIASGNLSSLPKLRRQDTIEIQANNSGLPSANITLQQNKKNVIYIIGAVGNPGPITFEENLDMMEALALAGGPSDRADMKRARVITKDGHFAQTIEINLDKYSKTGRPARYIMRNEDTFYLPYKKQSFLGIGLGTVAAVAGIITSAVFIYVQLREDDPVTQ